MSLFQPAPGEQPVYKGRAMHFFKKLLANPGEIHITDRRIVFEKYDTPGTSILVRMIVKAYRAAIVLDIPLKDVTRVYWKKFGLGKKLHIEYGDKTAVFNADHLDEILSFLPKVEGEVTA